ncbi:MAG: deoxyribonuclease IV [Peptococcaceae bacterium]|jgi:deoxyribonuclease-4|nr:deoxyribonuclease IV [Peptococcaceae bacterium]MDH7524188.1 deoxyribonuclease IV [Peptococcaceae bacterium]
MIIGAHVSISRGLSGAAAAAAEMTANTFQFFTRNPRGGSARRLEENDLEKGFVLMEEHKFGPIVAHAPYTYNLASPRSEVREFTISTLKDDMLRASQMKAPYLVLHPGTHGGQEEKTGLMLVGQGLRELLPVLPGDVSILIEGMAGEGSELGHSFDQLRAILEECGNHPQLGICLDTCHLTAAGYDLSKWKKVKEEFDRKIGLGRLKVVHLNDSVFPTGSRRDRHAKLGEGVLGLEVIKEIACDRDLRGIPLILETPNDNEGYAGEIALIKRLCGESY